MQKDHLLIIAKKLNKQERYVLEYLKEYKDKISFSELFDRIYKNKKEKYAELMRTLELLQNKSLLNLKDYEREFYVIQPELINYIKNGLPLPERRLLNLIKDRIKDRTYKEGIDIKQLRGIITEKEFNIALGILKSRLLVEIKNGKLFLTEKGKEQLKKKTFEEQLMKKIKTYKIPVDQFVLKDEEKFALANLMKRNLITKERIKEKIIILTDKIRMLPLEDLDKELIEKITSKIIKQKLYEKKQFRYYDLDVSIPNKTYGKLHFVTSAINEIKKIWIAMGFKEMKSRIIDSAFWDLDVLFVPQDHPARTMQDTFYLGKELRKLPNFSNIVKQIHETGGDTESIGWKYLWSPKEAKKILLRTHTTVTSARTLYTLKNKIIKNGKILTEKLPLRFFTIGKVYRNETLDAKHLFEFYQVDGIVIDTNANLAHLKYYLKEFFRNMGYKQIRLWPSYFPYTEPSLEIHVYDPEKREWVELAGAGILRPEVTKMLLGVEIPVLAWGIGLERVIARYYGFKDIRDLYRNNLKILREKKEFIL